MGLPRQRVDPDSAAHAATDRDERTHALVAVAWERWHRSLGAGTAHSSERLRDDAVAELERDPGVLRVQSVIDAIAAERRTEGAP